MYRRVDLASSSHPAALLKQVNDIVALSNAAKQTALAKMYMGFQVRSVFLLGYLVLSICMLLPVAGLAELSMSTFWESIIPSVLAALVLLSHAKWRLVCPLACASMISSRIKSSVGVRRFQFSAPKRIQAKSWLGQNHIYLQLILFILALSLRVIILDDSPIALAAFLLVTLSMAIVVGLKYSGRAWCHYFCPMGPVEAIVTGQRSIFGSSAHTDPPGTISQSTCRQVDENGSVKLDCTGCKSHCIDQDAEKSFWYNLKSAKALRTFWLSYPGLVIAYGWLSGQADRINTFQLTGAALVLSTLAASAMISYYALDYFSRLIRRNLEESGLLDESWQTSEQRTRIVATFLAINTYFLYSDPTRHVAGELGGDIVRALVLWATSMWLYRSWQRKEDHYRAEVVSAKKLGKKASGTRLS